MTKTMGAIICESRKNKGMTQAVLAQAMNVTDKAVSKWERDISCPDVTSLYNEPIKPHNKRRRIKV